MLWGWPGNLGNGHLKNAFWGWYILSLNHIQFNINFFRQTKTLDGPSSSLKRNQNSLSISPTLLILDICREKKKSIFNIGFNTSTLVIDDLVGLLWFSSSCVFLFTRTQCRVYFPDWLADCQMFSLYKSLLIITTIMMIIFLGNFKNWIFPSTENKKNNSCLQVQF